MENNKSNLFAFISLSFGDISSWEIIQSFPRSLKFVIAMETAKSFLIIENKTYNVQFINKNLIIIAICLCSNF